MQLGQVLEDSIADKRKTTVTKKIVSEPDKRKFTKPEIKVEYKKEEKPTYEVESIPVEQSQKASEDSADVANTKTLQYLHLLRFFGIESKPTPDETQKLKTVWSYVQDTYNLPKTSQIISKIVAIRNKLGVPRVGESPLDKVYRHVKLKSLQNEKV